MIALAWEIIDDGGDLIRDIISVCVAQAKDSTGSLEPIRCDVQVTIRAELETQRNSESGRERLDLIDLAVPIIVEEYQDLSGIGADKKSSARIKRHRDRARKSGCELGNVGRICESNEFETRRGTFLISLSNSTHRECDRRE